MKISTEINEQSPTLDGIIKTIGWSLYNNSIFRKKWFGYEKCGTISYIGDVIHIDAYGEPKVVITIAKFIEEVLKKEVEIIFRENKTVNCHSNGVTKYYD